MRTVWADEDAIEASRERCRASSASSGFAYGLIVGQRKPSEDRDVVVALIPTPVDPDAKRIVAGIETINESWLAQHSCQVARALPGGLDVLGLYVFMPSDKSGSKHAAAVTRVLSTSGGAIANELLYMCLCSTSRRCATPF